jgi:DUF4097 and DUF4098 domain-containing protein YvlB
MLTRRLFLAAACCCLVPALASAAESERFHKVLPLAPGGTLKLDTFSGDVRITGADVSQVTIDATRRADRDVLDHIKLDVQASGDMIVVDANKKDPGWEHRNKNVVETTFEIQVPRATRLDVHAFSSPVRVQGVTGRQRLETFSGRLEVVDGPAALSAKTFSAEIDLRVAANVAEPAIEVETFSGPIQLRVPDAARARVEFNTFSGDMTSDLPLTLQRQSRRHLVGELNGAGSGTVHLKSFSGDVKIVR